MKYFKFLLIILISLECKSQKTNINLLTVKDSSIIDIISLSVKEKNELYNLPERFIAMEFTKDSAGYECRIAFFNESIFKLFPPEQLARAVGYFNFGEYIAIVFSNEVPIFFIQCPQKKKFAFLHNKPKKKMRSEIKPPIPPFEPDVWIYRFNGNKFVFEKKGMFKFLGL